MVPPIRRAERCGSYPYRSYSHSGYRIRRATRRVAGEPPNSCDGRKVGESPRDRKGSVEQREAIPLDNRHKVRQDNGLGGGVVTQFGSYRTPPPESSGVP